MGDWVWYLGAGVLGVGGTVLFWWAWLGDRARGRARCGGCWYSLDALMGAADGNSVLPVCPECGWRGKRNGAYFRTRRRRAWALLAVVVAVGAAVCGVTPKVRRDGVWSVAPTWVMWGFARYGFHNDQFARELCQRYPPEQKELLAARVYRWTPSVHVTRDTWVRGVPLRARLTTTYSRIGPGNLRFALSGVGNSADVAGIQSHENWWTPNCYIPYNATREEGDRVLLDVVVNFDLTGRSSIPVSIALVDSIDKVMTPVRLTPETVLASIKPRMFVLPTTENLALSVVDPDFAGPDGSVALGLQAELVCKGEVVARARWVHRSSDPMGGRPVLVRFGAWPAVRFVRGPADERLINNPMTRSLDDLVADGCVVRFSTDEEMALSALECDKYWRGSFEVPLKDLVK